MIQLEPYKGAMYPLCFSARVGVSSPSTDSAFCQRKVREHAVIAVLKDTGVRRRAKHNLTESNVTSKTRSH